MYRGGGKLTGEEFEKIYQMYFSDVYYFVLSLSKNPHIAEDITSETFLKAIKAIDKFRGDSSLKAWLFQIGKNEYFSYLRKYKENTTLENIDITDNNILEKSVISVDQIKLINSVIKTLEEPYGEVFILRHYGEFSFKEIGKIFGKSDNWACVTYHRSRMKLQKELKGNYEIDL